MSRYVVEGRMYDRLEAERDLYRELVREADAMLGLGVDANSEWGHWRRRVAAAFDEQGATGPAASAPKEGSA